MENIFIYFMEQDPDDEKRLRLRGFKPVKIETPMEEIVKMSKQIEEKEKINIEAFFISKDKGPQIKHFINVDVLEFNELPKQDQEKICGYFNDGGKNLKELSDFFLFIKNRKTGFIHRIEKRNMKNIKILEDDYGL